ncbi:MAG TPA: DUF2752 domain-containing protein [Jatrophihabitans sp.]|nr:DUF2752 domain-containing protein [Jatrophihabitans sp.]
MIGGLYLVNPNTTHVPLCPLHAATGLDCPLCGGTRAAWALLHGRPVLALHDNALFVLALPVLLYLWLRQLRQQRQRGGRRLPRGVIWAVLALGIAFGIVRNLPFGHWLAPPA